MCMYTVPNIFCAFYYTAFLINTSIIFYIYIPMYIIHNTSNLHLIPMINQQKSGYTELMGSVMNRLLCQSA